MKYTLFFFFSFYHIPFQQQRWFSLIKWQCLPVRDTRQNSCLRAFYGKEWGRIYFTHKQQKKCASRGQQQDPESTLRDYERIDCKASCCWGCKEDQVEAKVEGGRFCCICLNRFIIRLAVCSVAKSFPAHRTCTSKLVSSRKKRDAQSIETYVI